MNQILKLIETRNLYVHLILFKIYLDTQGRTDTPFSGDMRNEIKELLGDEYTHDKFRIAEQYLESEGITQHMGSCFTNHGRSYFESWIENFMELNDADIDKLDEELPTKVFDFFNFTDKAKTVLSFINQLIQLRENILGN